MILVASKGATVYRGARRWYLKKASAYYSLAWQAIHAKYGPAVYEESITEDAHLCAIGGWVDPCRTDPVKLAKRLARWLRWRDSVLERRPVTTSEAALAMNNDPRVSA